MIESAHFKSPIGSLTILAVKEGVVKISFENECMEEIEKWSLDYLGMKTKEGAVFTTDARNEILSYLNGKRKSLDFPVIHLNSPFFKKVLEAQREIPYGETRSYGEVAHMVDSPRASRAIGSANANNPLPLYFPCHRIIYSDGSLGGFGGGSKVKEWLLKMEATYH